MAVERATCDQRVLVGYRFITHYSVLKFSRCIRIGRAIDRGEAGGGYSTAICYSNHTMYGLHVTDSRAVRNCTI